MRTAPRYLESILAVAIAGALTVSTQARAVTLNFSATLTDGTCTLSLDKSTLSLGTVSLSQLRPNNLAAPQPFILSVQDCTGSGSSTLKPAVTVTGTGSFQDGKWLFRNSASTTNAGVLVIQSVSEPDYSKHEVRDNSVISLGNLGEIPADQHMTFYAGASCGGSSGCASVRTGELTATLMFTFAYQ
ncbi:fimbrial protein [Pantoea deleyi]|uniref:fimbrial protein n=1 Tax=Pantoea deleyi TaxID=470932 RepID=UPI0035D4D368